MAEALKRWIVFAGPAYYPAGGFDDLVGWFSTFDEAKQAAVKERQDWWQVVEVASGQVT